MSLPYSPSRAIFEGNGITTRFPFSFTVWNSTQLQVSLTDTAGNTSTAQGWQVELSATGGTLIYELNNAPLPAGYSLAITRAMPFTQEIDLVSGTRFDAEAIEIAFDKACAERQQLREALARAVKLPETSLDTPENLVQNIYTARNEAQTAASHAAASELAAASSASLANTTVQAGLVSLEGARAEAVTAVGTAKSTALAAITDSQSAAVSAVQAEGAAQISAATTQANSAEASATAAAASAEAADTVLASAQTTISAAQSAAVTAVTTQQGTSIAAVETAQNTAIAAVGTEQATAIAAVQTQQASSTAAVQTEGAAQIALATAQADAAAASATAATGFATAAAGSAANAALSAEQASASANLSDASLTVKGIVMLSNAVGSTDETKSATPAAVKIAYDRASTGINAAAAAQTTANAAKTVTDLVSIAPAAGKIPQADENGKLAAGWLPSTFLAGGIVMFSGTFGGSDGKRPIPLGASAAEEGWALCDGSNGTPDLRGRFILGASEDYAQGSTGGAASAEVSGTTGATTLTVEQMPSHAHPFSAAAVAYTRVADSNYTTSEKRALLQSLNTSSTGGSQAHSHSMSGTISTLPPYYALAYIMKVAAA